MRPHYHPTLGSFFLTTFACTRVQLVEQFARFLREQNRQGRKIAVAREKGKRQPYLYPTVSVPASTVDNWVGLLSEGYEGDALEDSEALYDAA